MININIFNGDIGSIQNTDTKLAKHFSTKLQTNRELTRALVSFQANKNEPGYRWFKFKEGFSAALVNYVFGKLSITTGRVIDPFAGSGATLFAAAARGLDATGIELLPIGYEIIQTKRDALICRETVLRALGHWIKSRPWESLNAPRITFPHLKITRGAFQPSTERSLSRYLGSLKIVKDAASKSVLRLALLSILEEISFTRKDGQYLRWDYRSGRRQGAKRFDKGPIKNFSAAAIAKLEQLRHDLSEFHDLFHSIMTNEKHGRIDIIRGSCLEELPSIPSSSFDALMTSPPYCNRYDYTRTYALELALLGVTEDSLRALRQSLLSCTVENREKDNLETFFKKDTLNTATGIFEAQDFLQRTLHELDSLKNDGLLNNPGIPRMVKNYFWEMTLVILECARILKPGAPFVMVNDNVRYAGISIPVDFILSGIAQCVGYDVETIWVLPKGKGNSSQQMGEHGREELRKCVYIWRTAKAKPATQQVLQLAHQQ